MLLKFCDANNLAICIRDPTDVGTKKYYRRRQSSPHRYWGFQQDNLLWSTDQVHGESKTPAREVAVVEWCGK